MIAKVLSSAIVGLEARPLDVEVHVLARGIPEFHVVGLPNTAIREARRRVKSAILNTNENWPLGKITANLAPGDLKKEGAALDLPIAVGVLAASGVVDYKRAEKCLFLGELSLDGRLRPVRGAIAAAISARNLGVDALVLPVENYDEARLVPGVKVVGASHLLEVISFANGELEPLEPPRRDPPPSPRRSEPDLAEVRGQALARRALEICAVGGHNVLLVGPPGAGKTLVARALPGILPEMSFDESLEVTRIWSVAGLLEVGEIPVATRPFRAPHHHASPAAVIGGGSPVPRPGEISLAHRGVLFLDELPMFSRAVLEALRQPLEDGSVLIARRDGSLRFPARFSLVAAANPCLCSLPGENAGCICNPTRVDMYRARISGPLLDRIDLHVEVARLHSSELGELSASESSATVRQRVVSAVVRRQGRVSSEKHDMRLSDLQSRPRAFLLDAIENDVPSARAFQRTLSVARTIADIEGADDVEVEHLAEALQFRRGVWNQ